MDCQDHLISELPPLSDRSASDLLDLLQALFASLDSHYYVQAARYQRSLREAPTCPPPDTSPGTDSPF
jgi:hypothetical protein